MRRHNFDAISFVTGVLFIALGALFALDRLGKINLNIAWIPAIVLLGGGVAGVLSSLLPRSPRR